MKGRIALSNEGKMFTTSMLTYLKGGMDKQAAIFFAFMIKSIVSDLELYVSQMLKENSDGDPQDLSTFTIDQICSLMMLVKTFPEISVMITTCKVETKMEIPSEFSHYIPPSSGDDTFLSFFMRYACYFMSYSAYYFLEFLMKKSKTPIFVEYRGEKILLSNYHQLIIFQQIHQILEETLKTPKDLLRTFYTRAVWTLWAQMSKKLLQISQEEGQKSFKSEIVQSLTSLCTRALEVYSENLREEAQINEEKDGPLSEAQKESMIEKEEVDTKVLFVFLARLAELDVTNRTMKQLVPYREKMLEEDFSRQDILWTSYALKEQSYFGRYIPAVQGGEVEVKNVLEGRDEKIEHERLECQFESKGIDFEVLRGILKRSLCSTKEESDSDGKTLFSISRHTKNDLKVALGKYDVPDQEESRTSAIVSSILAVKAYDGPSLRYSAISLFCTNIMLVSLS